MPNIGVALSGGGHRAAALSLGTLLYLVDAGKNAEIGAISSVSGGSLTNGCVAHACDFEQVDRTQFRTAVHPFLQRIAVKGTLWGAYITWFYLLWTAIALLFVFYAAFCHKLIYERWLVDSGWVRSAVFVILLLLWGKLFLAQRGKVCALAYGETLFQSERSAPLLSSLDRRKIDHVLCATEMQTAQHFYFAGKFVYSYHFGVGTPGSLKLQDAMQSSASFPGGFPIRWFQKSRFDFQWIRKDRSSTSSANDVALLDGGVYDNMGEQWLIGSKERCADFQRANPRIEIAETEEIVVVNASSNFRFQSPGLLKFPILGELLTLVRVSDVMYDMTTGPRRRLLFKMFTAPPEERVPGSIIMIDQSPMDVAIKAYKWNEDSEVKARATKVLTKAGLLPAPDGHTGFNKTPEEKWQSLSDRNKNVATTLRALGVRSTAELMLHGYVAAMGNLHTFLDYPLLDIPTVEDMQKIIQGN